MAYLTSKKFSFASQAFPAHTFGVVRLKGAEGISQCYAFEIMLISDNREIDLTRAVHQPATLTFHREEGDDVDYHGILLHFEQLQEVETCALYRANLAPRLQWLSFTHHNQVFLGKTVPEIIEACLKDGGLTPMDFDMRLQGSYPPLEYVCQYKESHLAFISRWCEREGIYYFFEQTDRGEKVIFTDTRMAHTARPQGKVIFYSPPSGLEALHEKEVIRSFACKYSLTPASILLKDYDYMKPSLDITGRASVDERGRGQVYYYGDHIRTPEEGNSLAKIRAESLLCRRELFKAESAVPYISPGFTFDLKDHYRAGFNQTYLVTEVHHEGNQAGYLVSGLSLDDRGEKDVFYGNTFTAIPAKLQYRPEHLTPKPRISGAISAKIDAASSGQYAELDEHGRYKVTLPFDTSGRKNGKASAWIRMATPYIGSDHGMHFPLHKDTEVLLTFIDGDPDRPIITSAVPNPENPSPVSSANQTKSIITTASGNKIHIEDQARSERILMHTPNKGSFIRIGAHNDPAPDEEDKYHEGPEYKGYLDDSEGKLAHGIAKYTAGVFELEANVKNEVIVGESISIILGGRLWFTAGGLIDAVLGLRNEIQYPEICRFRNREWDVNFTNWKNYAERAVVRESKRKVAELQTRVIAEVQWAVGNELSGAEERTDALLNSTRLQGDVTKVVAQDLEAHTQRIHTIATKVETIGTKLRDAGQEISSSGTEMQESGVNVINTASQSMISAGTAINTSSGVIIDTAAQIMQV